MFFNYLRSRWDDLNQRLFRPKERTFRSVEFQGCKLVVPINEDVGWALYGRGRYEAEEFKILRRFVQQDWTCVDVGAHIGVYTVPLATLVPSGHVHAFEPQQVQRRLLSLNIDLNSIENVTVHARPLDRQASVERSFHRAEDSAFSSLENTGRRNVVAQETVETTSLDTFYKAQGVSIDLLKVDVEGAELEVLRGSKNLFSDRTARPEVILIEAEPRNLRVFDATPSDIVDYLSQRGYRLHSIKDGKPLDGNQPIGRNLLFRHSR